LFFFLGDLVTNEELCLAVLQYLDTEFPLDPRLIPQSTGLQMDLRRESLEFDLLQLIRNQLQVLFEFQCEC
jgi:hypothetical protein